MSLLTLFTGQLRVLCLGAIVSFILYISSHSELLSNFKPLGGFANWVTGFRLILIVISGIFVNYMPFTIFIYLLTLAVCLDVLDGYLARKYNQVSQFGQYFDMEVDAFFVLLMCFYYYINHSIPFWILLPGLLRYLFKLFTIIYPKPKFVETKKKYAATIAGMFFTVLLVSLILPNPWIYYILLIGSIAIVGSFSMSIVEYLRY